jgi:hypothetical protein
MKWNVAGLLQIVLKEETFVSMNKQPDFSVAYNTKFPTVYFAVRHA